MIYSTVSDWMAFSTHAPLTQAFWRRNKNMAEIKIIWTGDYFDTQNEAFTDAMLAAQKDVSIVSPVGLPKADVHNFTPEAITKLCPFSGKWYGSVCWKKFIGPILEWAPTVTLIEEK